jgi:integrase/recombinase XerC
MGSYGINYPKMTEKELAETGEKREKGGRPAGSHSVGWRTRKRAGSWLGLVRIPGENREESKSFDAQAKAREWARRRHADLLTGAGWAAKRVDGETESLSEDYLADLKARGRVESHRREVKRVLGMLAKAVPNLQAAGAAVAVERWLNEATASNARATRNRWLVTVRGLCRWAMRRRRLERDPTEMLERASVPEYLRPQFTVDELQRCLAQSHYRCPRGDEPKADPYHLLFAVLAYTGLRFQEAAHLRWEDIDWLGRVVMVRLAAGGRVKRQRERLVPLQAELAEILEPHRKDAGHLFKGKSWNPTRGFQNFLTRARVLVEGRSPHSLRHTYAGIMTASGVPGPLLSAYLGHTSAATTMEYTKLAARFVSVTAGWRRGEMRIVTSASEG